MEIADTEEPILLLEAPIFTRVGQYYFAHVGRRRYAMSLGVCTDAVGRLLALMSAAEVEASNVIPLCELCVRHNLPRHEPDH